MVKCNLEIISPVHIGSGEEYTNAEFIKDKLKNKDNNVNIFRRINLEKYYKSLDDNKKDDLIRCLTDNISIEDFDKNIIKKEYRKYLSYDKTNYDPKTIKESIKSLNKVYIPGGSIKGAIKTGLLYNLIEDVDVDKFINNKNGRYSADRRRWDRFVDSFFATKGKNSAQYNILRFLQISDSTGSSNPTIFDTKTIKVTDNGGNITHKLGREAIINTYETLYKKKLSFSLNNETNDKILNKLGLLNKKDIISLDNIKESLYTFNKDLIEHEIEFSKEYNIKYLKNFYNKLKSYNKLNKPLLRIGHGSGFLSTTIGLKIKNTDAFAYELLSKVNPRSYEYEFPKSREITLIGGKPFGWTSLIFKEE